VREAVRELLLRGLLRQRPDGLLEMHEVVRAGLERLVPVAVQRVSHSTLAAHYLSRGRAAEAVHHLAQAERKDEALELAKQEFAGGNGWGTLGPFVAASGLLAASDFTVWAAAEEMPKESYRLTPLARMCADPELASQLLDLVERNPERFEKDYRWAWWVTEMALSSCPSSLARLVRFAVDGASSDESPRLTHLVQAIGRLSIVVDGHVLARFQSQTVEVQWKLLPILLSDARLEVLRVALNHIARHGEGRDYMRDLRNHGTGMALKLHSYEAAEAVLLAIPRADVADLMVRRSPNYGALAPLLWNIREPLVAAALRATRERESSKELTLAALRFLAFVGHPETIQIAERFVSQGDEVAAMACFLPSLLPEQANRERYRNGYSMRVSRPSNGCSGSVFLLTSASPRASWPAC